MTADEKKALEIVEALRDPRLRQQLRLQRQTAGLTQMEVARRLKISHTTLSLFENGLGDIHPDVFSQLGKLLDLALKKVERGYEEQVDYAYESATRADGVAERKAIRQRAEVSQSQLAKDSQISQSRISLWETGKLELTKEEIVRWQLALRSGMERAIAKQALSEREVLKDEKQQMESAIRSVHPRVKQTFEDYQKQIQWYQAHVRNIQDAYQGEIRRLKKQNADLRKKLKSGAK